LLLYRSFFGGDPFVFLVIELIIVLSNKVSSVFGIFKNVCDIVVNRFTFAISTTDEFLYLLYVYIHSFTIYL